MCIQTQPMEQKEPATAPQHQQLDFLRMIHAQEYESEDEDDDR